MCFETMLLAAAGSALSAGGTKMQNDANNKAARTNMYNNEMARQRYEADLKEINEKNKAIDYENNARENADIASAEQIQFEKLQQDAYEAKVRNQVLADFAVRQREAAAANAATVAAGAQTYGAAGTEAVRHDAATGRASAAEAAIASGGETDPGFRGSTPDFVQGELAKALAASRATAGRDAASGAAVAAYGDAFGRQETGIGDLLKQIDLRNNFAKGDLSLLPAEQEFQGALVRKPLYAKPATLLSERWAAPNQQQVTQVQPKTSETGALLKGIGSLVGSFAGSSQAKNIGSTISGWFS